MGFEQQQKEKFLFDCREVAAQMRALRAAAKSLTLRYWARGHNAGAAGEIVEGDLAGTAFEGMPIAVLTGMITASEAYETWCVANAGYYEKMAG